jgi:hypothetical protein
MTACKTCVRGIDVAYLYDLSFVFWKPSWYLCARTVDFPSFSIGVLIFFVFHFIILNIVTVSIVACATGTFTGCTNDMMI